MSIATQTIDLSIIEKMEKYIENLKAFEELLKNQQKFIEGGGDLYKNLNQLISNYNKYLEFENAFLNSPILLKLKKIGKYVKISVGIITPLMKLWPIYLMIFTLYQAYKRLEIPKLFDKAEKKSEKTINEIIKNIKNIKCGQSLFKSNTKLFPFNSNGHNFPGISLEKINVNHRNGDREPINTLNEIANECFKFNNENNSQLLETLGFSLLVQGDSGVGKTHLVETQIPRYYDSSVLLSINTKSLINGVSSEPGIISRILDTFAPIKKLQNFFNDNNEISKNFLRNIDMLGKFLEKLNDEVLKLEKKRNNSEKIAIVVNFDEFEKFLDDQSVVDNISSDDLMKLFKFFDRFSNFQSESQYYENKTSRIIISMTSNKKLEETELFRKFELYANSNQQDMQTYLQTRLQGHKFDFENKSFIEILKFIREKCFKINNLNNTQYDFDKKICLFLETSILGALAAIKQNIGKVLNHKEEKDLAKNQALFKIIYVFLFDEEYDLNKLNNDEDNKEYKVLQESISGKIAEKFSDENKQKNIKELLKIQDNQRLFCMRDFNIAIDEIKDKLYPKTKVELTFFQKVAQFFGIK